MSSPSGPFDTDLPRRNDDGGTISSTHSVSIATMALETELEDCYARLVSGHVPLHSNYKSNNNNNHSSALHPAAQQAVGPFRVAFDAELERASTTIDALNHCTESNAQALLKNADGLRRRYSKENNSKENSIKNKKYTASLSIETNIVVQLRQHAVGLQDEAVDRLQQTQRNGEELKRIARQADAKIGTYCLTVCERRMRMEPWANNEQQVSSSSNICVLLSDIFHIIRCMEEQNNNNNNNNNSDSDSNKDYEWVAPSTFKRVTTKYWVTEENLPKVLLKSVSELPILVYGRKRQLLHENPATATPSFSSSISNNNNSNSTTTTNNSNDRKDVLWNSLACSISSVYFDSAHMDLYRERLKRSEGSQLFRARWYGDRKPTGEEVIFLELKTHHEKWVGEKSVKERVPIQEQDMHALLDTTTNSTGSGGVGSCWTVQYATDMVRRANPDNSDKKNQQGAILLLKIRTLVCSFHLFPCIRTKYLRVALQSVQTNNLRMTMDRDITVVDERQAATTGAANTNTASSSLPPSWWCLPDDAEVPWGAIVKIPYGVFEVKIAKAASPQFIQELKGDKAIIEAAKFSKFLTGVAIYNTDKVDTLPWWASDPSFVSLFQTTTTTSNNNDKHPFQQLVTGGISNGTFIQHSIEINDTNNSDAPIDSKHSWGKRKENGSLFDEIEEGKAIRLCAIDAALPSSVSSRNNKDHNNTNNNDKTGANWKGDAEYNLVSASSSGNKPPHSSGMLLRRTLTRFLRRGSEANKRPPIASKKPVRNEPKTHFANERTFLQWVRVSIIFLAFGELIQITLGVRSKSIVVYLFVLALLAAAYSVMQYYRRVYAMSRGKYDGFADYYGPGIFTSLMITAICMQLFYMLQTPAPGPILVAQEGICVSRSLEGVSKMVFQPSDAVVDEQNGLVLVPSLGTIISLSNGVPASNEVNDASVQILVDTLDEEFEALLYVGNKQHVYALSERGEQSSIIALERTFNGTLMSQMRWEIPSFSAKSMAYAPKSTLFEHPVLIIASDKGSHATSGENSFDRLRLDVYDFPLDQSKSALKANSRLNSKSIARGLNDTNVASMQYFQGLLYLLFDNQQLIRAVDKEGIIVQDVRLPTAEPGFETQWEGLSLQRMKNNDLVLHLALNAPAQVWSFKLDYDDTSGCGWKLPACASTS